jgi:hypothetical protein
MIPVFQESYRDPGEAPDESVQALLAFDGVHLLDRKNIHINHTISDLASLIRGTTPR